MINGIINIYKEKGYTSHDVVAKLRGILRQKKIGHTGTLDPEAEGVLLVCLGKATKLCDLLTDKDKTYEAVLKLGITTDTQDMTGKIIKEGQVDSSNDDIMNVISSFQGDYLQTPPMYSALKVNGRKLYELAREGIEVERKARPVTIHHIDANILSKDEARMLVSCSKGTYIRTLCYDIGEKLGCGGCMKSLVRTKVGRFVLEDSLTLSTVVEHRDNGSLDSYITKIDTIFSENSKLMIAEEFNKYLYNGNILQQNMFLPQPDHLTTKKVRVYDYLDQFIGLYEYQREENRYKPIKMFI